MPVIGFPEKIEIPSSLPKVGNWRDIPGWFTNEDAEVYRRVSKIVIRPAKIAEVGVWLGRSMGAMWDFFRMDAPTIYAIDTFKGTDGDLEQSAMIKSLGVNQRAAFLCCMEQIMIPPHRRGYSFNLIEKDSVTAAKDFRDHELDAVFIDADHSLLAVHADVLTWLPKVKRGGVIAGHDYDYPDVFMAVNDVIKGPIEKIGNCWLHIVQ